MNSISRISALILLLISFSLTSFSATPTHTFEGPDYLGSRAEPGDFPLIEAGQVPPLWVAANEHAGVQRVASHFQNDLTLVSGTRPGLHLGEQEAVPRVVVIGTLGQSALIDHLVAEGKLQVDDLQGQWEASSIQVVEQAFEGVDQALVIVGSDKRGTMYGMFDLSARMGVSPWYWWADVPVVKQERLYVKAGRHHLGAPKVQYRGIFLNDEEPALGGWVRETFGGFNASFYEKVYELILRMKGNFLWPAMWGKAHADDDINNAILADEYGIVINYSHHEPMMRAHVEWARYGEGPWDYTKNKEKLDAFWAEGIARNKGFESIITIGMRGDGDEAMSDDRNIDLLTHIVDNQRRIIAEEMEQPAEEVPQVWALYKEVQEYYDMGMRVPDDIMLLYCDDNWGQVRRMPTDKERARSGGLGMYYHFDYVGGPRNYKWLNTNPLPKVWEQNKLTYEYGIDKLWVVNVGDLKPMEFPIQFYLDMAWNPDRFEAEDIAPYTEQWARQQFGAEYATEIAGFMARYGKFNGRRTPEMLDQHTYSLTAYREMERVTGDYVALAREVAEVGAALPAEYQDAYHQLVRYPVEAMANLYQLYFATARNHWYAGQQRAGTTALADSVQHFFVQDSLMTQYFHQEMADGKWNHMMAQTRIGYTYWQQPEYNVQPEVKTFSPLLGAHPDLYVEGQEQSWSADHNRLPEFDAFKQQSHYLELFNQGDTPFKYRIKAKDKWVRLSSAKGSVEQQERILVSIDWSQVPFGTHSTQIEVKAGKRRMPVALSVWHPSPAESADIKGFVESDGCVAMEASGFTASRTVEGINWQVVPDLGRTRDGLVAQPYRVAEQTPGEGPSVTYPVYLRQPGKIKVYAYFSPTLNYPGAEGLKYGLSLNDQEVEVVNVHEDESDRAWEQWVGNGIMVHLSEHEVERAGKQELHFHMVSPGLVLERLVIDTGGLKESYLGPEESHFVE